MGFYGLLILDRWNVINLYSGTRGINRFKGLAMALDEINAQYTPIDGIAELVDWADKAPELSNDAVKLELSRHPIFQKVLNWSIAVNKSITELPQEEGKPFEHVREEWKRFGLIGSVDLLCTQEMSSKAYCISRLGEKGYGAESILMCGDAPGADQAAETNSVLCFPILVNQDNESWQLFLDEALEHFVKGTYTGE